MYIRTDAYKPPLAPHYKRPFPVISKNDKYFVIDFRTHNDVVSIDRLKAANLSFEALNSQVAADHSTSLQENFSMPATPPHLPSPEQSHPLQKPLTPSSTFHPQTRRGRLVKPPGRFLDFVKSCITPWHFVHLFLYICVWISLLCTVLFCVDSDSMNCVRGSTYVGHRTLPFF